MSCKHLLILGGYGNTGFPLARLLLAYSNCSITLAGRSLEKARQAAERLDAEAPGNRVRAACADAADGSSLRQAFQGVDMVVVVSSTTEYVETIARAVLECRADYFDVQYARSKMDCLQSLAGEIERAGRCFITDGGFHPGLPAAMVRSVSIVPLVERQVQIGSGSLPIPPKIAQHPFHSNCTRAQDRQVSATIAAGMVFFVSFSRGCGWRRIPCLPTSILLNLPVRGFALYNISQVVF